MKKLGLLLLLITVLVTACTDLGNEVTPINVPTSTTIQGNIDEDILLTADTQWTLKGYVYVTDGHTITIEAGTTIVSDIAEKGMLCIERGAKIIAIGTPSKPIVFTSGRPAGERAPGDWGGIVLLGKATTNRMTEPTIEGGVGRQYGGTDDTDNSGVLQYVRIEYAGIAAAPNSEINALTLAAVGSGTTIKYVQTVFANDDAFEFFGGTVSPEGLYSYGTADDDFDFDFGYRGTLSNSVSKRVAGFVDSGDAGNGVESDNDGAGTDVEPHTHPILKGVTLIGPNDASALPNHNVTMRWRRATQFEVYNSTFVGYMKGGISIESDETAGYYLSGVSKFKNNKIGAYNGVDYISKSGLLTSDEFKSMAEVDGNTTYTPSPDEVNFIANPTWSRGWTRFPNIGE